MSIYAEMTRRLALAAALLLPLALPVHAQTPAPGITVFAASSLTDSMKAVADAYQAKTGIKVTLSFGGSNVLAQQIDQGASADIFMSADVQWMDFVAKNNRIDPASRKDLLGNRLVLVGGANAKPVTIAPKFDLAGALGDGRLAMANPESVPAGIYGKAALTSLGVWDSVSGKIASAENVRAAMQFVSRGEAPYGIVYETDAKVDPGVHVVAAFPENSHPPILYPVALTRTAAAGAKDFLTYLSGPEAKAIFQKAGFSIL